MGVVFKAEDTKLGRTVALKFLPPDALGTEDEKARFVQEARAAAALDHSNISTVYEINDEDSETYISMAFIDGVSLKDKIEQGPLRVESALDISIQIADGLMAAHAKGIVHRDIKSANIMMAKNGQVKITDFGLAKLIGITGEGEKRSTMGTVAYMSPEQTRGDEVDGRTDIWSLGVVMYEMMAGLRPFRGDYEQSVIYAIVNEEPEPLTAIRTGVPMDFERIVTKALAKNRKHRYRSMEDLVHDLKRLKSDLDSKELLARRGVGGRSRSGLARRIAMPAAIIAVAALLIVYLGSGLREAEGAQVPIAVADFENTTGERELDGLSGMLITALEQSRRLSVFTRSSMFDVLENMGKEGVVRIDEALGREICREANVRVLVVASIRKFDELYSIDLKAFEIGKRGHLFAASEEGTGRASVPGMIDRIAQKTRKGLKEKTAHIQSSSDKIADVTTTNLDAYQQFFLGDQYLDQLKYEDAQAAYHKAIALDSTFALAHYRLAYASWWGREGEEIQRAKLERALALSDRLPEKYRYLLRAQYAVSEDGYPAGIKMLKAMEELYPDEKEMIYNIGDFSFHAGEYEQAEEYLQRVLETNPNSVRALDHLMLTYMAMKDQAKAIEMSKRYTELTKSDKAYIRLSEAYASRGDTKNALRVIEEARRDLPENPWIRRQVATVRCLNDEFTVARSILDSLVSEEQDISFRKEGYRSLRGANLYMGKYREALANADSGIDLAWETGDSATVLLEHQLKGIIYLWGWNDSKSAAAEFEKARMVYEMADASIFKEDVVQDYWANLTVYHLLGGHVERAREIAEKKLKDHPVFYDRFRFFELWGEGDYAGAQAVADSLLARDMDYDKTAILYFLAKSRMEHGDLTRAMASLQELQEKQHYAASRPFFYPPSYFLLAKGHEEGGDTKSAIRTYRKFLELWHDADPDLPMLREAKLRLAQLQGASTQ